jgi:hypothetical protein
VAGAVAVVPRAPGRIGLAAGDELSDLDEEPRYPPAPIRPVLTYSRHSCSIVGSAGSAATQQGHGRLACELLAADPGDEAPDLTRLLRIARAPTVVAGEWSAYAALAHE